MSRHKVGSRSSSRQRASASSASAETVQARAAELISALESGLGCLPAGAVLRAEAVLMKATARISKTGGHTVVALAGATGSGKKCVLWPS